MGPFVGPRRAKSWRADDWAGLAGRERIRAHLRKPGCGYAANPAFNCRIIFQHGWRWSCPDAHRPPTCRLGHRNDPTVRSDAAGMASTHQDDGR
jgi:hypothetical protein